MHRPLSETSREPSSKGLGGKNKKVPKKHVCGKSKVVKAKSRLTGSIIDKLHNYFGIALRSSWEREEYARCNISQYVSRHLFRL